MGVGNTVMKSLARSVGKVCGVELVDARRRWGVDVWVDVQRLVPREDITQIFDIGANVGQTALDLVNRFPAARVFAFEPVPAIFEELRQRTARFPRITPLNQGCGPASGRQEMHVYPKHPTLGSLIGDRPFAANHLVGEEKKIIPIDVTTVDDACAAHGLTRLDILKIDTEGYDKEVLKGAEETLASRKVRFVLCEFYRIREGEGDLVGLDEFLTGRGFTLAGIYTAGVNPAAGFLATRNALYARAGS